MDSVIRKIACPGWSLKHIDSAILGLHLDKSFLPRRRSYSMHDMQGVRNCEPELICCWRSAKLG